MASIVDPPINGKTDAQRAIERVERELQALERHRTDRGVRGVVLDPAGAAFCNGRALGLGEAIDSIRAALRSDV